MSTLPTQTEGPPAAGMSPEITSSDGLFAVDLDQRITHWAPSASRLLGITAAEALGRRCYDVTGGRDQRNARHCRRDCPVVSNARSGRPTPDYDVWMTDRSGEEAIFNVSILLCGSCPGDTTILHLFRDVTTRRRVERLAAGASSGLRESDVQPSTCALEPPTERQLAVVRLLAAGDDPDRIAEILGISPVTVRNHIQGAMERFGVSTRVQMVVAAAHAGLL